MKLKNIKFKYHKIFEDLELDFCDENKNPVDTIVLIGQNGVGKTTLLKEIYNTFYNHNKGYDYISNEEERVNDDNCSITIKNEKERSSILQSLYSSNESFSKKLDPKVVYMPTEINFEKLNKVDNTYKFSSGFLNIVDQNITQNIPSFIATKINKEIFRNRDKTIGEVIDKICNDINRIFDCMDMDVKLIGLSEDENTVPIFKNSLGKEFDISGLSSGEKQLFLRALSLKFLEVNNSVILIDEPEISLHPKWQKKIIKVYENIGENNQIIMATHSPHIVSDIEAKQLRIMKKDKDGIAVINGDDIDETYGQNVETILKGIMGTDNGIYK